MTTHPGRPSRVSRDTALEALRELLAAADQEIEELDQEIDRLRAFAQAILKDYPEFIPEDFEIQDLAVEHGLLKGVEATEPCAPDGACWCEGYDDFPQTCYRWTELLTGEE